MQPRKFFFYFPIIPRLLIQWANPERAQIFKTFGEETHHLNFTEVDRIHDFWGSRLHERIKQEHNLLRDPRDVAFLGTADGVSLTKQRNHTSFISKPSTPTY